MAKTSSSSAERDRWPGKDLLKMCVMTIPLSVFFFSLLVDNNHQNELNKLHRVILLFTCALLI